MTLPHAPPAASAGDGPFLRSFGLTFALLILGIAGVSLLLDPLGRFGTGLLPPVVSADRDQKAALIRDRKPGPGVVLLGSSRSKTIPPDCLTPGRAGRGFNFAVNGAAAEDLVAIGRFLRSLPASEVRSIFVGVDPEMLQARGGPHRPLAASRALARFAPASSVTAGPSLAADLLGGQVVSAALRSLSARFRRDPGPPEVVLDRDGVQRYPRIEALRAAGAFDEDAAVEGAIPGVLGRYQSFTGLDSARVAWLRVFVREARAGGAGVVAFIPPVHSRFAARARSTAWQQRSEETVALLHALELEGGLRYVETRDVVGDDPAAAGFVDALHFLGPVAARVAERLRGSPERCALQ